MSRLNPNKIEDSESDTFEEKKKTEYSTTEQDLVTRRVTRAASRKLSEEINQPQIENRFKRILRSNEYNSQNQNEGISKIQSSKIGSYLESIQENDDETSHENCFIKSQREERKSLSSEFQEETISNQRLRPRRSLRNLRSVITSPNQSEWYSQSYEDSSKEFKDSWLNDETYSRLKPYSQQCMIENRDSSLDLSYEQMNEINTITLSWSNDFDERVSINDKVNSQQLYKGNMLDDIIEINSSVEKCSIQKQLTILNTIGNSLSNSESDSEYWEEIIPEEDEWSLSEQEIEPDVWQKSIPWETVLRRSIRIKSKQNRDKQQLKTRLYNFRRTCKEKQPGYYKDSIETLDGI